MQELKLPIIVQSPSGELFMLVESTYQQKGVKLVHTGGSTYQYTETSCMEFIKDGTWIVKAAPREAVSTVHVDIDVTSIQEATKAANELVSALGKVKELLNV